MGEVVHVQFGTEREWETTRVKLADSLVTIGALFGDSEALMRAKAECIFGMLRQIVEEVPSVQVTTKLPENLSPEQIDGVTDSIKDAAVKAIEVTMQHAVSVLMSSIYDVATSKLAAGRRDG